MRNYVRISDSVYLDPKSFRYVGLKNGLAMEAARRRRQREFAKAADAAAAAGTTGDGNSLNGPQA
jgi:hypothetical protein